MGCCWSEESEPLGSTAEAYENLWIIEERQRTRNTGAFSSYRRFAK
jgi:hypothetical protein